MDNKHPVLKKRRKSRWHDADEVPSETIQVEDKPQDVNTSTSQVDIIREHTSKYTGCRNSDHYENLGKVGEGTYGAVYKARCRETNQLVALKKLKLEIETEGFPITSIRETITLLKGKHPNIINVREIVFGNKLDQIYIVMDYMDRDLKSLMRDMNRPFKIEEVKLLMKQLLSAIAHLHDNWIIHRDLKTSNLLIHKGILKVCDFGLAREFGSPLRQFTDNVVTLWYRAPELLLKLPGPYSTPIDVWSIGCIFGEILTRKPIFRGQTEIEQIRLIFETLGAPNDELWPDFGKFGLARKIKLPDYRYNRLLSLLDNDKILGDSGFHLWNRLLAYDPGNKGLSKPDMRKKNDRITAKESLDHDFFTEEPRPIHPSLFPTWPRENAIIP